MARPPTQLASTRVHHILLLEELASYTIRALMFYILLLKEEG